VDNARMKRLPLALLLAGCGGGDGAVDEPVDPASLPSEARFLAEVDKTRGFRDCFQTLRDPPFVPAASARRMRDEERVLGLDLGDVQFAYPLDYLNHHEIVEHESKGRTLLACWCPLCGTGVVHGRHVEGRVLTFGHSGWLWNNAYLLYDRETDSIWHHQSGVAMSGPLRGRRLPLHPETAVMTFAAWRAEHPETLVLEKPTDPKLPFDVDVYADRNAKRVFGLALELGGASRWYSFERLKELDAVEDELGGTPLVVVRDAAARAARAFDRRVDGRTLSFDAVAGPRPRLRERGGAREWFLRSGDPVEGSGAAGALRSLPATPFEADAWILQHPSGSIWRGR
jgi:hypothetical protein